MHLLVVDTNVLWLKDKGPMVNPEFDTFWNDHKGLLRMELVVPQVVRDELLFQHYASGKKLIDKVTEHTAEFSSVTAKKHRHRLSEGALKKLVREKFDRWLSGKDGKIAEVPIATINWKELYDRAIWRIPPFSSDAKNPDNEKGFRDALIYETVLELAKKKPSEVNIAFVSNDFVLRNALEGELIFDETFWPFEGLADFSSYVKLTREQLTEQFIGKIVKRVAEKFYRAGDENCLWNKEKVADKLIGIKDAWRIDEIEPRVTVNLPNYNLGRTVGFSSFASTQSAVTGEDYLPVTSVPSWKSTALNTWHLGPHEFLRTSGKRSYHWSSTVLAVKKYILYDGQVTTDERIRKIIFKVLWKADVKADARFYNIGLENVGLEKKEFRLPTPEEVQQYNLDHYTTPHGE